MGYHYLSSSQYHPFSLMKLLIVIEVILFLYKLLYFLFFDNMIKLIRLLMLIGGTNERS